MSVATRKKSKKQNDILKLHAMWREDMALFVDHAILHDTGIKMTPHQREACDELTKLILDMEKGKRRGLNGISIMAGKNCGKDTWAAWVIIWLLFCYVKVKIPCVSVSASQLRTVLWGEVREWLGRAQEFVRDAFQVDQESIYLKEIGKDPNSEAFAKAANPRDPGDGSNQVVGLQGLHANYLIQICDEVSGIKNRVLETLEENMAGPVNLMIMIFNPTRSTGYAVDSHQKDSEKEKWVRLQWNSTDSPIVAPEYIASKLKYGVDSNTYRVSVLGLPPLTDTDNLFPYDWVMAAVNKEIEPNEDNPIVMGFDVGFTGDISVLCWRKGPKVFPMKKNKMIDTVELKNWAGTIIDEVKPDVVRIDNIGSGTGVYDELKHQKGSIIEKADVRMTSSDPQRWKGKRMEMFWRLREAFEAGTISIPDDQDLIDQLTAIKTKHNHLELVPKHETKREIGRSPDEADALAFTYFRPDELVSRYRARKGRRPRPRARGAHAWLNH